MKLTVAIQMDPIEGVNIDADSTFALAEAAQRRGHVLWHYLVQHLSFREGRLVARARPLQVRRERGNHATLGPAEAIDLAQVDVVLMRQDPPFDMAYITATHLLEHVHPRTLVVNDPAEVRNAPEKLFVTHFPDLMPPTLITSGTRDLLLSDCARLSTKLRAAGVAAELRVWEGMWHVFEFYPQLPEAEASLKELGAFLKQHL